MLSEENQFYKKLLLMNMGVMFAAIAPGFGYQLFLPVSLLLIFSFFLLSQFYFGNFKLRLFSLTILLSQCFFIGNGMSAMTGGDPSDTYGFLFGLVFFVPIVYLLFNTRIWYNEITQTSQLKIDERQQYMEYIPLALTVVIFGFNLISGSPMKDETGIQSLSPNGFLFTGLGEVLKNRLLSRETLVVIPVLAILYFGRKNMLLGISLLFVYVVQIVIYGIGLVLKKNLLFGENDFQYPAFTGQEVVIKFILPIVVLIFYWRYFNKDGFFRTTFEFSGKAKDRLADEEERPVISMEDFKLKYHKLLLNESLPITISQFFSGTYLLFFAFSKTEFLPFDLLFGTLSVLGSVLFYFGVKSWNTGLLILGYSLQLLVLVLLISSSVYDPKLLGRLPDGTVITAFLGLVVVLVWGIPVLRSIINDENFVNFVQNRDNSRIHNDKPNFQMEKFDANQASIDYYADELIPWQQRKLATFIFLGLQSIGFMGFVFMQVGWSHSFVDNGSWFKFQILSEIIILLMLHVSILKWGMFQNLSFCILMLITYSVSSIGLAFQLLNSSQVTTFQSVVFFVNTGLSIYFIYMIVQLIQRKRSTQNPKRENLEVID